MFTSEIAISAMSGPDWLASKPHQPPPLYHLPQDSATSPQGIQPQYSVSKSTTLIVELIMMLVSVYPLYLVCALRPLSCIFSRLTAIYRWLLRLGVASLNETCHPTNLHYPLQVRISHPSQFILRLAPLVDPYRLTPFVFQRLQLPLWTPSP